MRVLYHSFKSRKNLGIEILNLRTRYMKGLCFSSVRKNPNEKHIVSLQLDYYMSPQFAGIACAMSNNLYDKAGIELRFLPICPVGLELHRVRDNADKVDASSLTIGTVEQNIFTPTLSRNPELKVKAIAAMFRKSPLCLASLKPMESIGKGILGTHEDTVSLLERILESKTNSASNSISVTAIPRATKITDLMEGNVDMIQAYTTTEVPTLEILNKDKDVFFEILEGMNGAKLGYCQTLFSPEEDLKDEGKREIVKRFLDATFSGWEMAIRDVESAAKDVEEVKSMLKLDDENNDHWDKSFSYTVKNVGLCCDYVKETFQGDKYGVIDSKRWNKATNWLLEGEGHDGGNAGNDFGFDPAIWQPSPKG